MPVRPTRKVRVISLLAAAAAAGALTLTTPAQAVIGDAVADNTYTFTAKIDVGGVRACSGTLLNNQWMVTAASCFTEDPAQFASLPAGAPALKSTATIGRTNLIGTTGEVRQITQLIPRTDRDLGRWHHHRPRLRRGRRDQGEELRLRRRR
ncbi:trypsin-like serine protease [Streptomyces sp. NPDC059970]|uniref:trypsin-like serine protease n=1 Tax=Streptomyces sp. NPDC059970 TaxID=3347019 RepID=UPI0036883C25